MAYLKLVKLKCTGQSKTLKIQPHLNASDGKKVGGVTKIDAPGTVKISARGNDPNASGNNPIKVDIFSDRLYAVDLAPAVDKAYEASSILKLTGNTTERYPFKTLPGFTMEIFYQTQDNFISFTLSYVNRVGTLAATFIREVAIATTTYFGGISTLLIAPFRRSTDDAQESDEIDSSNS